MRTKLTQTLNTTLVVCIALITACAPSRPEIFKINPAYGKYVSAYTSGMINRKSTIRVELSADEIKEIGGPQGEKDKEIIKDIFKFEPEIKGKTVWVSDRIIEFIPEKTLDVGQFYNVEFGLGQVSNTEKEFKKFNFQFSTYQQKMFVRSYGVKNYGNRHINVKKITGVITLSDFADIKKLEKTFTATQNGKELPIKIRNNR